MNSYDDATQWDDAPGGVVTIQHTLTRDLSDGMARGSYFDFMSAKANVSAATSAANIDA